MNKSINESMNKWMNKQANEWVDKINNKSENGTILTVNLYPAKCLATTTHNFKWVKITHICLISAQIFHFIPNNSDLVD